VGLDTIRTPYGAAALEVLRELVREAKDDDPMAAVTILVPDNITGIVARRSLAGGVSDARSGIAGLHIATLARLAEQLGSARLAPRRPATNPILAAAWRAALNRDPGLFDETLAHPKTIRALVRAHRELRDLSRIALDLVASASPLSADLVRLHRDVTAALTAEWYDQTDLLDAAVAQLPAGSAAAAVGRVVLYLPQALTRAEARFAQALAAAGPVTIVAGMTDVQRADRVVRRSLDRVGAPLDGPHGTPRVAHEVFHASDSDDEVRCIVRDLVRTLRTTPAHRVALLYGSTSPYGRLLEEHLAAAGVAVNGAGTRPVVERAIGRAFLGVLQLAETDLPRADLFRALSEAPTYAFDGTRLPTSRWERLSRSAAVVQGDDWRDRLDKLARSLEAQLSALRADDDTYRSTIDARQRDLDDVTSFQDFATTLRARLLAGRRLADWRSLSSWAVDLFTTLYGGPQQLAQIPGEEQVAAVTIRSVLLGLAELDAFEPVADLRGLVEALSLELESALGRVGRFGDGVLVAPLSAAIGLDVDVVYAIGLAEDSYPGRLAEDPLLLEQVRDASAGELASYRDRLDAQHRQLLAAFDAAPRVVASFPRGDLRRSTGRLPSRWLLGTLRHLSGDRRLTATEWETAVSARISGSPSYTSSLTALNMPATEQEWRTRTAATGRPLDDAVVASGLDLVKARAGAAFTRFDGNLAGVAGLADFADGERPIAPTALEAYATCPHAYFVERLLRVRPVEQPEEIITISPLDVGNLIHETMDQFVTESAATLPTFAEPWSASHRQRLHDIAVARSAEFEARGATGHRTLWESERDRILADLEYMLTDDDERRLRSQAKVVRSELKFGRDGADPVTINVDSGRVRLRGSADLVEQRRDGTLVVIDIKTGGTSRFKAMRADPLAAGTKLQLPVYAQAAVQLLGGQRAEAAYWFVRQGKRDWIPVELTAELEHRFANALGTLVDSISAGLFPAKAPDAPDFAWVQCPYCNPDGLGHGEARARWERKRHDPALAALVGLVEPGILDEPAAEEGP